ncbi:hypothetical protein [Haloparvum sp. PAK95]|uniref:hypothetical protein n=1 Tax=Haloparvum sp. PAK95 TaxID=3418962 RepID=UPI003D2F29E0
MSVLSSLPERPLQESEVVSLNRSEELELAVATETNGPTAGLVVAADDWVKGLAFDGTWADGFEGDWTVVDTVTLDDAERYEGLQQCEDAVRAFLGETETESADETAASGGASDGGDSGDGDGGGDDDGNGDGD